MKIRKTDEDVYILAIESSCDETAAAVVKNGREVLSNVISSQIALHTLYGGVVPEIASRKHIEKINQVIREALKEASMTLEEMTAIAVTYGPGLVGALLVGVAEAKAIAYAAKKPLVGVHHIEGHVSANFIEHPDLEPPFVCLIVSGGHTHLVIVKDYGEFEIIGRTMDDAAGEAFDKVARAVGLGYPGGPKVDKAAKEGFSKSKAITPDEDFRNAILRNNAVFSAFKVHRMQNDMARLLLDSNGILKPFDKWVQEVLPIASHQVRHWLRTEYDTAVIRAHQAADWQQFLRERDILPNLKWLPSTSIHPGADHRPFWNTIRPIDDTFWNIHRPGDRWNCKCDLTATDEEPTPLPDEDDKNKPQPGLDNNPGTDGKLFSDNHPYQAEAHKGAQKRWINLWPVLTR